MLKLSKVRFYGDYKTQMHDIIDDYYMEWHNYPIEARISLIDALIDRYITHTGERPDGKILYRLGNVLLYDYLEGDSRKDKMQREEYPILTKAQYKRRVMGIHNRVNNEGDINHEVPLKHANNIGLDGANHALPIRRYY